MSDSVAFETDDEEVKLEAEPVIPELPNEVYGKIIEIGDFDQETLVSLCLVSKSFFHFARIELYSFLRLAITSVDNPNPVESWNEAVKGGLTSLLLFRTLLDNPSYATLPRALRLEQRDWTIDGNDWAYPAIASIFETAEQMKLLKLQFIMGSCLPPLSHLLKLYSPSALEEVEITIDYNTCRDSTQPLYDIINSLPSSITELSLIFFDVVTRVIRPPEEGTPSPKFQLKSFYTYTSGYMVLFKHVTALTAGSIEQMTLLDVIHDIELDLSSFKSVKSLVMGYKRVDPDPTIGQVLKHVGKTVSVLPRLEELELDFVGPSLVYGMAGSVPTFDWTDEETDAFFWKFPSTLTGLKINSVPHEILLRYLRDESWRPTLEVFNFGSREEDEDDEAGREEIKKEGEKRGWEVIVRPVIKRETSKWNVTRVDDQTYTAGNMTFSFASDGEENDEGEEDDDGDGESDEEEDEEGANDYEEEDGEAEPKDEAELEERFAEMEVSERE